MIRSLAREDEHPEITRIWSAARARPDAPCEASVRSSCAARREARAMRSGDPMAGLPTPAGRGVPESPRTHVDDE